MSTATGGAPAPCKPSHASLATLEIPSWVKAPDGTPLQAMSPIELRRQVAPFLKGIGSLGHTAVASKWIARLQEVYDAAGRAAVSDFIERRGDIV